MEGLSCILKQENIYIYMPPALTGGGNCGVKDSPWGSIGGPSPPDRGFTQSGCQASTAPDRFSKIVLGVGLFETSKKRAEIKPAGDLATRPTSSNQDRETGIG